MGQRVRNVMRELGGEKIDIIDWDEDPGTFVGNALSPAKALSVTVLDEEAKAARVRTRLSAFAGYRERRPKCTFSCTFDWMAN